MAEQQSTGWVPYGNVDSAELDALINRISIALSILLFVALATSLSRYTVTGWVMVYNIHVTLYLVLLFTTLFRHRLDTRVKAGVIVLACFVVAAVGHYTFGLMAGGVFFLPLAVVVLVFYFELRQVVLFGVISIGGLFFVARGFISGQLALPQELEQLERDVTQWANYGYSMATFLFMMAMVMISYRRILGNMIDAMGSQRDEIIRLTNFDQLTGIATLSLATQQLTSLLKSETAEGEFHALMLVDLSNLDEINDTYGYDQGDLVLKEAGARITALLRPGDMAARISGGIYLVILSGLKSKERVRFLAERISESIGKPFRQVASDLAVHCHLGITYFSSGDTDPRHLIMQANSARLQAEREQRDSFELE